MRAELQEIKDAIAILFFVIFPVFIIIEPTKITWVFVATFLFGGALLDAAFTLFLCATGHLYASTVKDGFGAVGLFAMGATAMILGETLVVRTILCCFFIMAGVVDILSLTFAYNGVYNVYTHNLRPYGQMLPVSRDDA